MLLLYADTSSLTGVMSPVGITTLLMGFYYIWKSVWVFFFLKKKVGFGDVYPIVLYLDALRHIKRIITYWNVNGTKIKTVKIERGNKEGPRALFKERLRTRKKNPEV